MMRSDEFLALAVELVAAGSEARHRTAVNGIRNIARSGHVIHLAKVKRVHREAHQ
jgi:hypothetical protein